MTALDLFRYTVASYCIVLRGGSDPLNKQKHQNPSRHVVDHSWTRGARYAHRYADTAAGPQLLLRTRRAISHLHDLPSLERARRRIVQLGPNSRNYLPTETHPGWHPLPERAVAPYVRLEARHDASVRPRRA